MQYSMQSIFNWLLSQIGGFFYLRSIPFSNSKTISQLNSEVYNFLVIDFCSKNFLQNLFGIMYYIINADTRNRVHLSINFVKNIYQ